MKIIYLHQYFNTPEMSGSTRSYEFAKHLTKIGHDVSVITTYRKPNNINKWFKTNYDGIKIYWLPLKYSNKMSYLNRLKSFAIFAWKSYFKAKKFEADIVYASSTPLSIVLPGVFVSRNKNIPLILEVRDLWPDIPIAMKIIKNPFLIFFFKLLESWAYKNSNSIITLSPEMRMGIILKKVDSRKIATIPNSSNLELFECDKKLALSFRNERTWLRNKPLLLYAGAFGKVNDLTYSVKLAKQLIDQKSNIRILLIGDGLEKEMLINEAKKLDVYERNLFIESPLPKKYMPICYSAADIVANFVIDIEENWANSANKFFDGLAAGKPIFLNHGGWMSNLVKKYHCGLCMHGKKIEIVAKELDLAISNEHWLSSSGMASKNLAKKLFDRDIHLKQLEKILILTKNNKNYMLEGVTHELYKNI